MIITPATIIIPSRNVSNVTATVESIRLKCDWQIVIIWDVRGGEPPKFPRHEKILIVEFPVQAERDGFQWSYARACNRGMEIAESLGPRPFNWDAPNPGNRTGCPDVILWNDDAMLLFGMPQDLSPYVDSSYGIVSARVYGPAHAAHKYEENHYGGVMPQSFRARAFVPFVCAWLSGRMLDRIGLLDTRFVPGGFEDNDLCRRAYAGGFSAAVTDGVVVDHQTLPHSFRHADGTDSYDFATNKARFEEKWKAK